MARRSTTFVFALAIAVSATAFGALLTENFNTNTDGSWDKVSTDLTNPGDGSPGTPNAQGQNYQWRSSDFTGNASFGAPYNITGTGGGELGGTFTGQSTPPVSYYAFEIGPFNPATDEFLARGVIRLVSRGESSGYVLGFFNASTSFDQSGFPEDFLGFYFEDGHETYILPEGHNITDDGQPDPGTGGGVTVPFRIDWNPHSGGLATMRIANSEYFSAIEPGGILNRFGIAPVNFNGGSLEVYIDDLTFTVNNIIPEPTGLGLLVLGALAALRRHRRS